MLLALTRHWKRFARWGSSKESVVAHEASFAFATNIPWHLPWRRCSKRSACVWTGSSPTFGRLSSAYLLLPGRFGCSALQPRGLTHLATPLIWR